MKRLLIFLTIFTTSALAANPSYTCKPEQGCIEPQGPAYDIGRGVNITLPDGWKLFSYPTAPLPIMAGLREIRAFKNGVVIAITPIPIVDQRTITEGMLRDIEAQAATRYVNQSKEQAINVVSISHGDVIGCYSSFTANNEEERPFSVLPNRRFSSVTSFSISYKRIIFSVSVASERLPDTDYLAAVNAVREIQ